jgi:membrane associated rhomboid family serine protease
MSDSCPLCGAQLGEGNEAWLHLQEVHGGDAPARRRPRDRPPPPPSDSRDAPGWTPPADRPTQPPYRDNDNRAGPTPVPHGSAAEHPDAHPTPPPAGRGLLRESFSSGPATMTIIAVTIAVWLLHEALLRSGINTDNTLAGNGNLGGDGQWWRLITPVVVHFGALHLIFNMLWIYQLGPAVERIMGRWLYVGSYLLTALSGDICSDAIYYHRANFISGGASGAVYGIGGILVGAYLMARSIERRHPGQHRPGELSFNGEAIRSLGIFFGLYLIIGQAFHVDSAAHFGGGVMGLAIGAILSWVHNGPRAASVGEPGN